MTGRQMIDKFNILIDDDMGDTTALMLLNMAKDELETERPWKYLTKVDDSQVAEVSDTYLTTKPLPADFFQINSYGYIYVGEDIQPYIMVPYEERYRWKNITHAWYLDLANNEFAICGGVSGPKTIHFPYQKYTEDILENTSPKIPGTFHMIYVLQAAMNFFAVDQGDKSRAWDDRWNIRYQKLKESLIQWDASIQLPALQNSVRTDRIDYAAYPNIADMP